LKNSCQKIKNLLNIFSARKDMSNFLSQKSNHYIANKIYNNKYQYSQRDIEIIDIHMLSSIILNQNKKLFNSIIKSKNLSRKDKYYLLNIITNEGDEYIDFFNILYDEKIVDNDFKLNMISNLIKSNSIKILNGFNLDLFNVKKINESFKFNPNEKILNWIITLKKDYLINNDEILDFIIKNDYLNLFKMYVHYNKIINDSIFLDKAIKENAYDIIDYLLSEMKEYNINKDISIYDEYFNYLSTLTFNKIELFLSKTKDIKIFGVKNLETLLLGINNNENLEKVLLDYNLLEIKTNNLDLNLKIGKIKLNYKLKKELKIKNTENKKEKI